MVTNNLAKILFTGISAILLEGVAQSQINVIIKPTSGKAEMGVGTGGNAPVWPKDGKSPDYAAEITLPFTGYSGPYSGKASALQSSVSGSISCGADQSRGASSGGYTMDVYADVAPGSDIRVKFKADLAVKWVGTNMNAGAGFSFPATGAADKGFVLSRQSDSVSPLNDNRQWSVAVKAAATSDYSSGGKPYYKLGTFNITGGAEIYNANTNAEYSSKITDIKAYYIGNVLSIDTDGGNNQSWVPKKQFPKQLRVKVSDNETGEPIPWKAIAFRISWPESPANYFPDGYPSFPGVGSFHIGWTGTNGMVETPLINGSANYGLPSQPYYVKATCDSCIEGQREVTFTETVVTPESVTELSVVQCESYAAINTPVRNSFVVRAFNTLTHEGEPNWTISFNKEVFPAGSAGQKILPSSTLTNPQGIAFSSMWTGDKVGGYTYRAVCPSCLAYPQVWCSVLAAQPPKVEARPLDDGPEAGDPSVTPMLRISNIYYPNDGVSFTTHEAENTVAMEAELRPTTPEYAALKGSIAWEVKDSPRDAPDMNSGDPDDPAPGESTAFEVTAPPTLSGRQLPLKYMIQAEVMTPKGLIRSYPRHIKQDDIDKCRQEYIDYIDAGKALNLSEVPRSRFTPGVDSEFLEEKDRGDCYAYIYPQARAGEVLGLRALHQGAFGIKVKSGYRSPRVNFLRTPNASPKSRHMYGDAVDIVPTPKNNTTKNLLWPTVGAPKMLEKSVAPNILLKHRTSGEILTIRDSDFSTKYNPKDTNGDGFTDTVQDGDTVLQIKNMSWVTLKKYLADSNGDGIPNIIESTEWMHLGE